MSAIEVLARHLSSQDVEVLEYGSQGHNHYIKVRFARTVDKVMTIIDLARKLGLRFNDVFVNSSEDETVASFTFVEAVSWRE